MDNSKAKYAPEVADLAADICAIAASNRDFHAAYGRIASELGLDRESSPELTLALAAWDKCHNAVFDAHPIRDAEAEALLRSGWQP